MRLFRVLPPIVWAATAFASGIMAADRWPLSPGPACGLAAAVAALWIAALLARAAGIGSLAALACFAGLGFAQAVLHTDLTPSWPAAADGQQVEARGIIVGPPEAGALGWRGVARLHSLEVRQSPRAPPLSPAYGLVRLTGRGQAPDVGVGAEVLVRGRFRLGRPAGNPGERSEQDALRRRGLLGVIRVTPGGGITVLRPGARSVRGAVASMRQSVVAGVLRALPSPHDGLLLSLLLGIETHVPPDLYRQFSRAGLVHLMVVSGAQVAMVAGACAWTARLGRLPPLPSTVAGVLGVGLFAVFVGWAPSVGRATIMTVVGLTAAVLGRGRDRAATLAAAALVLLVSQPQVLFDIGFQLSFAATWGLLYVAPVLRLRLVCLGPFLAPALAATLGAQLAVAPLLAAHFQVLLGAGVLANALALPVIAALVPAGLALIPLVVVAPASGDLLLSLLRLPLEAVLWIGSRFGSLGWAAVPTPPVSPVAAAALFLLMGTCVAVLSGCWHMRRSQLLAGVAVWVCALALWYAAALRPPSALVVTVMDVGQGDAILVQSPSGQALLIDGGGSAGGDRIGWDVGLMRVVPALRRAGVRRLDAVILSHPHDDHVGGLLAVLENFPVGLVLDSGVAQPAPLYARLLNVAEARRVPRRAVREGVGLDLGAGVGLTVLHPPDPSPRIEGEPAHAGAMVARLTYGVTAALLTGDIEAPVEQHLLDRGTTLQSQVLKVAHHGSRTSTTPAFLTMVRPGIAVISVGADNSFGHPHPGTLAALESAGAVIYRTDRDGAVTLRSDGTRWQATTMRSRTRALGR